MSQVNWVSNHPKLKRDIKTYNKICVIPFKRIVALWASFTVNTFISYLYVKIPTKRNVIILQISLW